MEEEERMERWEDFWMSCESPIRERLQMYRRYVSIKQLPRRFGRRRDFQFRKL